MSPSMEKLELVLLPIPAAGHLIALVEMVSRLLRHDRRFSATVLLMRPIPGIPPVSAAASYIDAAAASSGLDIRFEDLPTADLPDPVECDGVGPIISVAVQRHAPLVKAALSRRQLASCGLVVALLIDFFATPAIDAARELGIPSYLVFTSNAATLASMLHVSAIQERFSSSNPGDDAWIEVPGVIPVPYPFFPPFLKDWESETFAWFAYHGEMFLKTKGMILNTFHDLEPAPLDALASGRCVPRGPTPPVYALGPIIKLGSGGENGKEPHECIRWLDEQPAASVVFLCFGSMGQFDVEQVAVIAAGLERSGHRFLWSLSVRGPEAGERIEKVLPAGFVERTRGRGTVLPAPVPQVEILAHAAVGGFVTHCGWNSVLESLWFGVPMLSWPLYAEQHFNGYRMTARELGIAVGLVEEEGGVVGAEAVEKGVRCLMGDCEQGAKVRRRCGEMKAASRKALVEGGSSFVALLTLAKDLAKSHQ